MMTKIVVRQERTRNWIGEYTSNMIPSINHVISTPFTNYLVTTVQHDLDNKLSVTPELECITLYVKEYHDEQ